MIIVTGGAGFIGSNLVKAINDKSGSDVMVVDNLANTAKVGNLSDCKITDYRDKNDFYQSLQNLDKISGLEAVLHQGACSDTMVTDGRYVMHNNYQFSRLLLEYCQHYKIPYLYASSASVYGSGKQFQEKPEFEKPLNAYAYSKLAFDQHVRSRRSQITIPVVGLRYFNVYGPRENHKGRMASVAYHFYQQYSKNQKVNLFRGCEGYGDGEQLRDFISVDDVVNVNFYFLDNPHISGIFNLGTGRSQSFNEVAAAVVNYFRRKQNMDVMSVEQMQNDGHIEYIPFPENLIGKYQSFTQADIKALRDAGYKREFLTVEQGVNRYLEWLDN